MVKQGTHNSLSGGSIPSVGTIYKENKNAICMRSVWTYPR